MIRRTLPIAALLLFGCTAQSGEHAEGQADQHATHDHDGGGAVVFPVSCSEAVQDDFNAAVAAIHNMTFNNARTQFQQILEADPNCGMAHWGIGMSYIHPLWFDHPPESAMQDGLERVAAARAADLSDREAAYVDALAVYYDSADVELMARLKLYADAMASVYQAYPDDLEAKAFYSVTHLSTATPGSIDMPVIEEASSAALEVLAARPEHPGGHHYLIHAFDYSELAERAVEVARSYAKLAPDNPHSLHMPTHIFTRLGMWDASIELNARAAVAAEAQPFGDAVSVHYPHALDYMLYAYLQTGQDTKAYETVQAIRAIEPPVQEHPASAYPLASAEARYTLERHDWTGAVAINSRIPADYPWDQAPQFEALTHYGVALGGARLGNEDAAVSAIKRLEELEGRTEHPYWKNQVKVLRLASEAWLADNAGDAERAEALMTESAELEASMSKHPTTPGEVLPSGELLGDLMLAHGKPAEALAAYESALARTPNRFNSLYGAGQAAEALGNSDQAREFYQQLVDVCDEADTERAELAYAREYVTG